MTDFLAPVFDPSLSNLSFDSRTRLRGRDKHLTPEFTLLVACAALDKGAKNRNVRTSLQDDGFDWREFLRITVHHRLIPQAYDSLRECTLVPSQVLARLRNLYEANVRQTLRLTCDLQRVLKHFQDRQIPMLPYKGPTLAAMLQVGFTERQFSDLDLLVLPLDVQRSKRALQELGYKPGFALNSQQERSYVRSGYEYSFDLPDARNVLELKWRVLPHFCSIEFDVAGFFDRSVLVEVSGVWMPTLAREDMLLLSCVHAAKHAWSELSLLWDVSRLIESRPDWTRVFDEADKLGIRRILEINLKLTQGFLGCTSDDYKISKSDRTAVVVRDRVLPIILDSEQVDTEAAAYFRLMVNLRERWRDRFRFVWRLLSTPNRGEWSAVRLPSALFPMYHLVRMYRLAVRLIKFPVFRTTHPENRPV